MLAVAAALMKEVAVAQQVAQVVAVMAQSLVVNPQLMELQTQAVGAGERPLVDRVHRAVRA
jgi:hypothetical protein